jgi:transposase-like protein
MMNIKQRGVSNVFCFVADGFQGVPDTINSYFPKSDFQSCVVHRGYCLMQGKRLRDIALKIHKLYEFYIIVHLQAFWAKYAETLAL